MALEQNFHESFAQFDSVGDCSLNQKWKSVSASASENMNGCFDCNICLDSALDPVVTLCGHLYCWPCIYKWLNVQHSSPESEEHSKCPVCKANILSSSLVPLYGRGASPSESEAKQPPRLDLVIPHRPPALGANTPTSMASYPTQQLHPYPFHPRPHLFRHQEYFPQPFGNYASMSSNNFGSTSMTSFFYSTVGMVGEMVLARMLGRSDASLFTHPHHPNSYRSSGSGSPRMRRQEMQVDKSLNRVSIFLFCCLVLCLLSF